MGLPFLSVTSKTPILGCWKDEKSSSSALNGRIYRWLHHKTSTRMYRTDLAYSTISLWQWKSLSKEIRTNYSNNKAENRFKIPRYRCSRTAKGTFHPDFYLLDQNLTLGYPWSSREASARLFRRCRQPIRTNKEWHVHW